MTPAEHLLTLFSLGGRTAVVTGGSSGIGRAIAVALARAGARTVLLARDPRRIDAAVAEIRADGGDVIGVPADLGSRAGVRAAISVLEHVAGEPDVLVSAAGVNLRPPLPEVDESVWDATMRVNLDAPFLLGQRFAPGMAERGFGRLIGISS